MEILQLKQFKAIAEKGNMTKAADSLYVSQPTLSAMLKRLEQELGLSLFTREKNHLILTDAGKLLLHHASIILEAEQNAVDALDRLKKQETQLHIGFCDPGPMWYYSPRYNMAGFKKEMNAEVYPDISEESAYLQSGRYDAIISYGMIEHPRIESIPLVREYFFLSVSKDHPLAKAASVSLRETRIPEILLLYVEGSFFQGQRAFWEEIAPYTHLEQCSDYFIYTQRIKNTDIPTLSTFLSRNYRDDGGNRILIPLSDPELYLDYHISYLKENRKKLKTYLEWMKKA